MLQRARERAHDASAELLNRPSRTLQSLADYVELVRFALQPRTADEQLNGHFVVQ